MVDYISSQAPLQPYKGFSKDSSVGKTLLPAVAFLNLLFTLSMILVVYIIRLISTG